MLNNVAICKDEFIGDNFEMFSFKFKFNKQFLCFNVYFLDIF